MRAAINGLGRGGLIAVMAALAVALVATMVIYAPAIRHRGAPVEARFCHSTGSATNPYVLVVVQAGGPQEQAIRTI